MITPTNQPSDLELFLIMNMTASRLAKKVGFKNIAELSEYTEEVNGTKMSIDQFDYMFENYPLRFNLLLLGAAQTKAMFILGINEEEI